MTRMTFHTSTPLDLRTGEPACHCGKCGLPRAQARGNDRASLIEAAISRMPRANEGTRQHLRTMSTRDLQTLVAGLPGPGLRVHAARSDDEDVRAMVGGLSFRPNARIAGQNRGGNPRPGQPHSRENMDEDDDEMKLAEQLRNQSGGEMLPPSSSFRANKNIGDGSPALGVIHRRYQPAPAKPPEQLHVMSADELDGCPMPPSSFTPNTRLASRRAR
jgi:hypothetical protein